MGRGDATAGDQQPLDSFREEAAIGYLVRRAAPLKALLPGKISPVTGMMDIDWAGAPHNSVRKTFGFENVIFRQYIVADDPTGVANPDPILP